jgi:hypothetical protein
MLGQPKLAMCFQIPSQASLQGIVKANRSICGANGPATPTKIYRRKYGVRLEFQVGRCFEKAPASWHASLFFRANPAFGHLFFIRVYPSNPWFKNFLKTIYV